MQTALEAAADLAAFPKATADVYCLVLEAGGSELSVAVTAAALALADAGIPLFDLVSACSVVSASNVAVAVVKVLSVVRHSLLSAPAALSCMTAAPPPLIHAAHCFCSAPRPLPAVAEPSGRQPAAGPHS